MGWVCRPLQERLQHRGFVGGADAVPHALQGGLEGTSRPSFRHETAEAGQQHHIGGLGQNGRRDQVGAEGMADHYSPLSIGRIGVREPGWLYRWLGAIPSIAALPLPAMALKVTLPRAPGASITAPAMHGDRLLHRRGIGSVMASV